MRRLAGAVFKPLEPRIRELTRSLLAEVLERPAFDFAAVLPDDVMCELVGIPAADRAQIRADNDLLNHCEDGSGQRLHSRRDSIAAARPRGRTAASRSAEGSYLTGTVTLADRVG
jgi:cytochrome P450